MVSFLKMKEVWNKWLKNEVDMLCLRRPIGSVVEYAQYIAICVFLKHSSIKTHIL